MKKSFFLMLLISFTTGILAQNPLEQVLPNDPNVRIGVLSNGMTYYIAKNDKPANMASFYIIHNVGAMQEEDHQDGLAHFLEHMAFNGTKNFPDKTLLEYLEGIGVQFGRNINAYTSQEETVYMMKDVPMSRETIIDSALLVLNDWSHYISLEHDEIDSERGVIIEELRTGLGASRRIFNKLAPVYFNGTKYSDRLIIGTEEILKTFKYQDIKDFYEKWYRPDNQAIVVVGDFDIDAVEAKIKNLFSKIPKSENGAEVDVVIIPKYKEDVVTVITDPEQSYILAMVMTPVESLPQEMNNTMMAVVRNNILGIMSTIINERLAELAQSPDAKFVQAFVGVSSRTRHNDALSVNVIPKGTDVESAIKAVVTEVVRVREHGFSIGALERAKANMLKSAEQTYANRDSRKNDEIVSLAQNNFINNAPILSPEMRYQISTQLIQNTSLEMLNNMIGEVFTEYPSAIMVMAPEKDFESINAESVKKAYQETQKLKVEKIVEEIITDPLIANEPTPVAIKSEKVDKLGNVVWTLSNGAKVILRTTDYKKDELVFSAVKPGGNSLLDTKELIATEIISGVASSSGAGNFDASELRKVLAGKSVSMSFGISSLESFMGGNSSISDIETMLQLFYLNYTAPSFTEDGLLQVKKQLEVSLANISTNPDVAFSDSLTVSIYNNNPRSITTTMLANKYNDITIDELNSIHSTVFNGVDGANFYFVGNVSKEVLKPLVEKYIASLPKGDKTPFKKGVTPTFAKGDIETIFNREQENPKAKVGVVFSVDGLDYSLENILAFDALRHVLRIRYIETIREEHGASYGVGVGGSMYKYPKSRAIVIAQFDTNDKQALEMTDIITTELKNIADNGPEESDLQKAKEVFAKNFANSQIENRAWLGWIKTLYEDELNYVKNYEQAVDGLTVEQVQSAAKLLIDSSNKIEVIMLP